MNIDGWKKNVKEFTTAKSSKKIEEFGEVYSSILLGMHSDMNQYRRQVDKTQNLINSVDHRLETGLQQIEESFLAIQQDKQEIHSTKQRIQQVYSDVEKLFKSFYLTAAEVSSYKNEVSKLNDNFHSQQQNLTEALNAISSLTETLRKQEEEIKLYKTVVFIVSGVVVLLLFFVIWSF